MKWFILLFAIFQTYTSAQATDIYTQSIQPIFNSRCIACHSCLNAPCQLNLQNYEGFLRGAQKQNIYSTNHIDPVAPTRLWIDAQTPQEWQNKGFYSVNTSKDPANNLFFQMIALKAAEKTAPTKTVFESQFCPATLTETKVAMPYALPGLNSEEQKTLEKWVQLGAPGPSPEAQKELSFVSPEIKKQIQSWEEFFNQSDLRHKLVSRYLYEHLFLAHIYFPQEPQTFFRLVRSSTQCDKGINEIATRRPNDNPGVESFQYCLRKFSAAVVAKTHIPYELSPAKKERIDNLFFKSDWKVNRLPTYNYQEAENPFLAFADIPPKSRYQFLLDDAQYQVSTFIKGPVCNGSVAVNSIQEQFFMFFIHPDSEIMARSRGFQDQAQPLLILPGVWGSDVKLGDTPTFMAKLNDHREKFRSLRARWKKELFPKGYALNDIWDGDDDNPNAVLTVIRHDDNAVVMTGAVGDLSKTVVILDYALFERLVYNLVVNFDVFGNIGHQLLTRDYMDMLRMEAEEIFLSFLPPDERLPMRDSWYQGFAAELKMKYLYPVLNKDLPTSITYTSKNIKKEFIEKVLFTLMNEKVRGPLDPINWKNIEIPENLKVSKEKPQVASPSIELELRKIAAVVAHNDTPFARFFPDISLLQVKEKNGEQKVYSIMHNKEHQNISWILAESLRMSPNEDSLVIREGYWGFFPNMFFTVSKEQLPLFTAQILKMRSRKNYLKLVQDFGVPRTQDRFWTVYDELNTHFRKTEPIQFGYLDLTRYEM
ncbi:MAG: fatty acid cis/trans isomerase [Pseudobdellovibrionaceae bacterium]